MQICGSHKVLESIGKTLDARELFDILPFVQDLKKMYGMYDQRLQE